MAKKSVLGLDIGARYIKMVEVQHKRNECIVDNLAMFESSSENLSEQIKANFAANNFTATSVVSSVSGKSVAVRYITMQDVDEKELKSVIKLEASKYLPFSEDEDIVLDCQKLTGTKAQEGQSNVLLVGVKRDYLNYTINLLQQLALRPIAIDVDAFALGNIYEFQQTQLLKNDISNKVVALVDIGASKTIINIMDGNLSVFTREFYIAGNNFTEAIAKKLLCPDKEAENLKMNKEETAKLKSVLTKPITDLCQEISMSLDYFTNRYDKDVNEILFSGGGALLPDFLEEVKTNLLKPVRFWNPFDGFSINKDRVNSKVLETGYQRFAIALGLAIRTE